ncbi:MAG: AbrB/MazE/SpoVT family DNA-binding domain-containing protein [Patescibacteria group bacterium]|nr:AbrB/MazE/SpoVT family DNA-binding domain-containing protein [Patescibacteria group bacterium]
MPKKATKDSGFGVICGATSLGKRGQLVIPKEARERLHFKEGERFLVVEHLGKVVLVPEEQMQHIVSEITRHLKK